MIEIVMFFYAFVLFFQTKSRRRRESLRIEFNSEYMVENNHIQILPLSTKKVFASTSNYSGISIKRTPSVQKKVFAL